MTESTPPFDEAARLAALHQSRALDLQREELTQVAKDAATVARAPIALITFVDADRVWVKAAVGLETEDIDRHSAFCAWAIYNAETTFIPDAASDVRFADNPLVAETPRIRFYAGAPIVTSDGYALGAVCVMDDAPREADEELSLHLKTLAARVSASLSRSRASPSQADGAS